MAATAGRWASGCACMVMVPFMTTMKVTIMSMMMTMMGMEKKVGTPMGDDH